MPTWIMTFQACLIDLCKKDYQMSLLHISPIGGYVMVVCELTDCRELLIEQYVGIGLNLRGNFTPFQPYFL